MHYQEYCKVQDVPQTSPVGKPDFFEHLHQISMKQYSVLSQIEHMLPRKSSKVGMVLARISDILLSNMGLIICALPFLVISVAIKINSRGPIFYRQQRVGRKGEIFEIIKFRTMFHAAESTTGPVWASANDPRLTSVGAFLRDTKLDELPQLFNILKGDMTFVGPRPERPEFVYWYIKYMPAFDRRHDVKPGLTGLAQLMSGYDQSASDVYKKLRWDIRYIQTKCLRVDLWLVFDTVISLLRGKL